MVAYCAGCIESLNPVTPAIHILDLIFGKDTAISGKAKISKPPFTYLNRLRLKAQFKKSYKKSISRERTFTFKENLNKKDDILS